MTSLALASEPDEEPAVTADDLATMLRVTRERIWQMRCRGQLPPAYKISRTEVLWDRAEFHAWLNSKKEK